MNNFVNVTVDVNGKSISEACDLLQALEQSSAFELKCKGVVSAEVLGEKEGEAKDRKQKAERQNIYSCNIVWYEDGEIGEDHIVSSGLIYAEDTPEDDVCFFHFDSEVEFLESYWEEGAGIEPPDGEFAITDYHLIASFPNDCAVGVCVECGEWVQMARMRGTTRMKGRHSEVVRVCAVCKAKEQTANYGELSFRDKVRISSGK